jgi:hypothetical protein
LRTNLNEHPIQQKHKKDKHRIQTSQVAMVQYTGYFMSDNGPGGIENATHNTLGGKAGYLWPPCPLSLSLVKYPVENDRVDDIS